MLNDKYIIYINMIKASIAQLGERQTEDLKVPGSIPGGGIQYMFIFIFIIKKNVLANGGFDPPTFGL